MLASLYGVVQRSYPVTILVPENVVYVWPEGENIYVDGP